jgi:hypothetical protein
MGVGGQVQAPAALFTGTDPTVQIVQEFDWAQSRSGRGGAEKETLSLPESNPSLPARNLVTVLS